MAYDKAFVILIFLSLRTTAEEGRECESGWKEFPQGCYREYDSPLSWTTAQENCRINDASLLSTADAHSLGPILLRNKHLSRLPRVLHVYHHPEKSSLRTREKSSCWSINDHGEIRVIDCRSQTLPSICTRRLSEEGDCPTGFQVFENECFAFFDDLKSQADAKKFCETHSALGGSLAIIRNERQNNFIKGLSEIKKPYIGLEHLDGNGTYGWPDGSVIQRHDYINWAPNEPSSPSTNQEPCVEFINGQWNDCGCGFLKPFICQTEKYHRNDKQCEFQGGEIPWIYDSSTKMCYALLKKQRNWENAVRECALLGESSNLVSITSPHEESFIRRQFMDRGRRGNYWIGLRKAGSDIFWSDLSPLSYLNWKSLPETGCALTSFRQGSNSWSFQDCFVNRLFPAICQRKAHDYKEPVTPTPNDCPIGWMRSGTDCFYFSKVEKNYEDAIIHCKGLHIHANLAVIKHKEMNDFLDDMIKEPTYLGLNDKENEGKFVWVDGSVLDGSSFTGWASGTPYDPNHERNCVNYREKGWGVVKSGWVDVKCETELAFVCSMTYSVCPYDSTIINQRCLQVMKQKANCDEAEAICAKNLHKGHLASVHGVDENEVIRRSLTSSQDFLWLGLKKEKGVQNFSKWNDGSAIDFEKFKMDDDHSEAAVCATMDWTGQWYKFETRFDLQIACSAKATAYTRCGLGWTKSESSCYYLGRDKVDYHEAKASCEKKKGYLAKVETKSELAFIEATYPFQSPDSHHGASEENLWIGLSSKRGSHYYVYEDTSELILDNWKADSISDNSKKDCVWAQENRLWATASCDETAYFLCERPQELSLIPLPSQNGCKETQMAFEYFCYELYILKHPYNKAYVFCTHNQAQLLTLKTLEIQNRILSYVAGVKEDVYIDLKYEVQSGTWRWGNGYNPDYTNWAIGEPKLDGFEGENIICTMMMTTGANFGKWKTTQCDVEAVFVCESKREGHSSPLPPTTTPLDPSYKCPDGFYMHEAHCYLISQDQEDRPPLSFDKAEKECERYGARLAVFQSLEAQRSLFEKYELNSVYIGIRYVPYLNKFVSMDPEIPTLTYEDWYENGEDLSEEKYCVEVLTMWRTTYCSHPLDYICSINPGKHSFTTQAAPTPIPEVPCDEHNDGWFVFPDLDTTACYMIGPKDTSISWFDARHSCIAQGGNLASIHNHATNNALWLKLQELEIYDTLWIGLNNLFPDAVHRWSDGSVFGYRNWADGEPNGHISSEGCVEFYSTQYGRWNDLQCLAENNYICKKPRYGVPTTPTQSPIPKGHCKEGVPEFEGHCYTTIPSRKLNWQDAILKCLELDSKSVSIHNEREASFLVSRVFPLMEDDALIWSGGNDGIEQGSFYWSDGSAFDYTNWAMHEPDLVLNKHCLALDNEYSFQLGQWFMQDCSNEQHFICKSPVDSSLNDFTFNLPHCESDAEFTQYLDGCYLYVDEPRTWADAKAFCESKSSTLMSIHDNRQNSFLHSTSQGDVWMGLATRDEHHHHPNILLWTDGSTYNYHRFQENATLIPHTQSCVYMDSISSQWKMSTCDTKRSFMCQQRPDTGPSAGYCPQLPNWKSGPKDHCYNFLSARGIDYDIAMSNCEYNGGVLAGIHSAEDNEWIFKKIKHSDIHSSPYQWIGVYIVREEDDIYYQWLDNEPFVAGYHNWQTLNHPNSSVYGAIKMDTGKWELMPSDELLDYYICSARKVLPTHPPMHSTVTPPSPSDSETSDGMSGGAIAGVIIGTLLALTLVGGLVILQFRSDLLTIPYDRFSRFWT